MKNPRKKEKGKRKNLRTLGLVLGTFAFLLLPFSLARSATIICNLVDIPGTSLNALVRIQYKSGLQGVGTNTLAGYTAEFTPVAGVVTMNNIQTGRYQVNIGRNPPVTMWVPDSTNTFQFNALVTDPSTFNAFGQIRTDFNDTVGGYLEEELLAGSNISLTKSTNSGNRKLTISAAVGSLSLTNAGVVHSASNGAVSSGPVLYSEITPFTADQFHELVTQQTSGTGVLVRQQDGDLTGDSSAQQFTYDSILANAHALGSIAGGGTATLVTNRTSYTLTTTGSTWTLALPASMPDRIVTLFGTCTFATDVQVCTLGNSAYRLELAATTNSFRIQQGTASKYVITAKVTSGQFEWFSVSGDDFSGLVSATSVSVVGSGVFATSPHVQDALEKLDQKKASTNALGTVAFTGDYDDLVDEPDIISQAEAEAGVGTVRRVVTAQRLKQAVSALTDLSFLSVYASGTAATVGSSPALVDFGTTDPSLTISASGKYEMKAQCNVRYVGATYSTDQTITVKLRRTNNTAADISNATHTRDLELVTQFTGSAGQIVLPTIYYDTPRNDDIIQLWASVSATPGAGSVQIDQASITALRVGPGTTDVTAPTVSSATIDSTGTTLTLVMSEPTTYGAGGNGGLTITPSGGASTATFSSGAGTTTLVWTLSRTIQQGETVTRSYTNPGNGFEDAAGNDLGNFSGAAVTNNSTVQNSTLKQSLGGTGSGLTVFSTGKAYVGDIFTADSNYTLTSVKGFVRYNANVPNGTISAYLYAVGGSPAHPTTLIATSSTTLDSATLTTSIAAYTFNFSGSSLSNGTQYAIIFGKAITSPTSIIMDASATGSFEKSADAATWYSSSGNTFRIETYGY